MSRFQKATKKKAKARVALVGPSGAGKTYTSLLMARELAQGGPIAVIDTERGSASKYSDVVDFDVCELESFSPVEYVRALEDAAAAGYKVVVIDSYSHAWSGKDGALDQVDKRGGKFQAWREVTPLHQALVDAILGYPGHVIATMRAKTEYLVEDGKGGKKEVRKVGLAPVQREGVDFEFDVVAEMDHSHVMHVTKSRCSALADQAIRSPGADVAKTLLQWLDDGVSPADDLVRLYSQADDARGFTAANRRAQQLASALSSDDKMKVRAAAEAAKARVTGQVERGEGEAAE